MQPEEFDNKLKEKFKFDFSSPVKSEVNGKILRKFLEKDKEPVLVFYGGEPLLEIDKINEIMRALKDTKCKFRMQTNGLLLDQLDSKNINRIGKILVSLDGGKERTDFNRGKGTYEKVMKNLDYIKRKGYRGEVVARMTISGFPDVGEQVANLVDAGFLSVHWQLDAGFYSSDFDKNKFKEFVKKYNQEISELADYWIQDMKANARVLKFYPFLAIMDDLLEKRTTRLRCGAGENGYAITTDGKIIACPIMNGIVDFEAGDLFSLPERLKKFSIKGRCLKCEDYGLCGGRCLYWNYSRLWPEEGDDLICKTVKHLIKEMKRVLPEIIELLKKGTIQKKDFDYEKYFGPEIIP
jgi:putative peptide-modifying radical SAM enzyme